MGDSNKVPKGKIRFECCNSSQTSSELLTCKSCNKKYHFACVISSKTEYSDLSKEFKSSWFCPACNRPQAGKDNSNTPVRVLSNINKQEANMNVTIRNKQKSSTTPENDSNDLTLAEVRKVVREELMNLLDVFKSSIISQFEFKLKEISDQLTEVTTSISFMEQQHEKIKTEMQNKIKSINQLEADNKILRTDLNVLNARLSQIEQQSRASNLEIQCLPEHRNENLITVVKQISNVIKFNLNESDIHLCTRIAKIEKTSTRPRSILVKFSCPRIRDEFLAATIKFNKNAVKNDKLNSSHAGLGGDHKPIYVVEHLSPNQKALHAAARLKAKSLNYRFVWVKRGQVFMRKNETSEYKFIRNLDSLNNLD